MKKIKTVLAGLCTSVLIASATPSIAMSGADIISKAIKKAQKEENISRIYETRIEKLADYLENSMFADDTTTYGSHNIHFHHGFYEDREGFFVSISGINFLILADYKDNGYGSVDTVYKEEVEAFNKDGKDFHTWERHKANVTTEEKEKFNVLFHKLVDKFYYEIMPVLELYEKKAKQDKEMKELFDVLKKK